MTDPLCSLTLFTIGSLYNRSRYMSICTVGWHMYSTLAKISRFFTQLRNFVVLPCRIKSVDFHNLNGIERRKCLYFISSGADPGGMGGYIPPIIWHHPLQYFSCLKDNQNNCQIAGKVLKKCSKPCNFRNFPPAAGFLLTFHSTKNQYTILTEKFSVSRWLLPWSLANSPLR